MELTVEFKQKVREAMIEHRANRGGSNADFAKSLGINGSVYSRIVNKGTLDKMLSDSKWIQIGRMLDVSTNTNNWKVAETSIYREINSALQFCQEYTKSMVLADDCGIGKTFCTRHIIKSMKNAFYIDCSQAKTKSLFIRLLAKTLGVDDKGRYADVKADVKYYINLLEKPLIVLDEAGDLDYKAFVEIKELWNGTKSAWFMMGADGLQAKINRGINNKTVGYAEIFSRFSDEFVRLVPQGKDDRQAFYKRLLSDVAVVNCEDSTKIDKMVRQCLNKETTLRHLEILIKMAV